MEPKEPIEIRRKMAEMHQSVLERIDTSYAKGNHIEVCWLCYACFESRVNRVLEKICSGCTKPISQRKRHIGISTKLECYVQLIKHGYPPLQNEDLNLIQTVKGWCKERNALIHGMISLDVYNDADMKFQDLAESGIVLVRRMYALGTDVREYFYQADSIPRFDEKTQTKCRLEYKCI